MSYTKGPWEFDYRNEQVTDSEGNTVVWETNSNIHDGNLIAAAPELLDALIDIADDYSERFDMDSPSTNPGMKQVVAAARAAIAKAKGEVR